MCGLCGVLSDDIDLQQFDTFRQLMVVSTLRGQDGAGVAAVPKKLSGQIVLLRAHDRTAAELAYGSDMVDLSRRDLTCLIGHARFPTQGGFDISDIHPHVTDHIVVCHNGTLSSVDGTRVGKKDNDSAMLSQAMAALGVQQALETCVGSYAVTVIDKRTDTLYFARNDDRPLRFARYKNERALYWASEANMLELVLRRRQRQNNDVEHFGLKKGVLVSYRLHSTQGATFIDCVPLKTQPITKPAATSDKPIKMYQIMPDTFVAAEDLWAMLLVGCSWCQTKKDMSDYMNRDLMWYKTGGTHEFICRECAKHDDNARHWVQAHGGSLPSDITDHPPIPRLS